jgi:hypothetical protein
MTLQREGWPWLLIAWLAAWRLTAMLCYERGPFGVLARARAVMARWTRLLTCFHCTGLWVSAGVSLAVFGPHPTTIVVALAVAGAASATERSLGAAAPDL